MNKTLTPINSLKVTLGAAVVTIGALAFAYNPDIGGTAPAENKTVPAYTAVAAMALSSASTGTAVIRLDGFTLDVSFEFEKFEEKHIQEYLDSGLCFGKAGSIMVEGFCKPYIKNVIGYESCAMGLCVEKLKNFL